MTKRGVARKKSDRLPSRQAILRLLKQQGPRDAQALASQLSISAMAVRQHLRRIGLEIRSGVHVGECEEIGGQLVGIAVHIGSRVLGIAEPGEVLVSSTVRDLVAGSGIEFDDRGEHTLRGIAGQWRLYAARAA